MFGIWFTSIRCLDISDAAFATFQLSPLLTEQPENVNLPCSSSKGLIGVSSAAQLDHLISEAFQSLISIINASGDENASKDLAEVSANKIVD